MSKELSGVTMLHYAKQNIDEDGKVTFEAPKRLKDAKEVKNRHHACDAYSAHLKVWNISFHCLCKDR